MNIKFKDFSNYLTKEEYNDSEIRHLFHAIKSMDKESRAWVVEWFNEDTLPMDEIEGVTAEYLIDECGYKPLNAFIILDWLKADPQAAKYFLLKIPSTTSPSDTIGADIERKMLEEGMEISDINSDIDLSDIEE